MRARLALVGLLLKTPATITLVSTMALSMADADLPNRFADGFLNGRRRDILRARADFIDDGPAFIEDAPFLGVRELGRGDDLGDDAAAQDEFHRLTNAA